MRKSNLHLIIDGKEIELFPTPYFVTRMCLIDDSGKYNRELIGKSAKAAVARYLVWVNYQSSNPFASREAIEKGIHSIDHIVMVSSAVSEGKQIKVFAD